MSVIVNIEVTMALHTVFFLSPGTKIKLVKSFSNAAACALHLQLQRESTKDTSSYTTKDNRLPHYYKEIKFENLNVAQSFVASSKMTHSIKGNNFIYLNNLKMQTYFFLNNCSRTVLVPDSERDPSMTDLRGVTVAPIK